jgi:CheY-like chemotaxis protein/HPt (histidine-containing phosphotransfer) domain-containing protein
MLRGRRALVVDDTEINRSILERQLIGEGMVVEQVADGAAALAAIDRAIAADAPFDFLLVDYSMPDMDGIAVAEAVRMGSPDHQPKIVLVSSLDGETSRQRIEAAFDARLSKPIRHGELIACLSGVAAGASPEPVSTPKPASPARPTRPNGFRLLLAEDNAINRLLAATLLAGAGYAVDIAEDGLQAIEAIRCTNYDLVIMDVQMPKVDGVQATKAVRCLGDGKGRMPIIALTANAMAGDRELYLRAGMNDYVTKPLDPESFLRTVAAWIDAGESAPTAEAQPGMVDHTLPLVDEASLGGLQAMIPHDKFQEIITGYLDGAREGLAKIETMTAARDFAGIIREAHDFKGTSGNFGARRLYGLADQLERVAKAGDAQAAGDLVRQMRATSVETWGLMRRWLSPQNGSRAARRLSVQ